MDDEDDTMQPGEEFPQCTTVDSSKLPEFVGTPGGIHPSLNRDGETDREGEAENVDGRELDKALPLPEIGVSDELAAVEVSEGVICGETVVESKPGSEDEVAVNETLVENVGEMVSEARDELIRDGVVVEAAESENADNVNDTEEEPVRVDEGLVHRASEVKDELIGDGVVEKAVEKENESRIVENVTDNEEEQVRVEGMKEAVITEELSEDEENDEKVKKLEANREEDRSEGMEEDDDVEVEVDNSSSDVIKNGESMVEETIADVEMEPEIETVESVSDGKRKRGRNDKPETPVKPPSRKLVGDDVCFICLDGGDLVLCDRRGCPKTYHPSCVDHDDEFFKTKDRWVCGWHLCNKCGKNAYSMCYTCQFSLCKACSKDAAFFRLKGNKGFCELCMKTIMAIENIEQNEMGQDAFSDKSSWEYLFKDYWLEQKEKFCITSDEVSKAQNPLKDSDKLQTPIEIHEDNNVAGGDSDSSRGNLLGDSRRKKAKRKFKTIDYNTDGSMEKNASSGKRNSKSRLNSHTKELNSDSETSAPDTNGKGNKKARRLSKSRLKGVSSVAADDSAGDVTKWASKELLEFVTHMKNGDQSALTQFDVQELLLEYIKRNKLRDPHRRSQIICDSMLQKLFYKQRVGHFEMLKLLESHFLLKDAVDNQGSVADTELRQLDADDDTYLAQDNRKNKGKKLHKKGEGRGSQSNLDDYAAIDMHNINLIFLRRNLMEALMVNPGTFNDKVVGSFARIRIYGSNQKQEMYRLVQIIGTRKAAKPYKLGKRTTDVMLEILNLAKTETISIDTVSSQDFFEDECKRLRQSIKCGLINRLTVGDIVEKARELHEVKVVGWLEAEITRLSHLRDRASEKGRKKELRECVEKLQLLKTPEERQRKLDSIPKVHADPKMDPSWESEDELDSLRQASDTKGKDYFSPRKGGSGSSDSWSANARLPNQGPKPSRNSFGKGFPDGREDSVMSSLTRDHIRSNGVDKGPPLPNSGEKPRTTSESSIRADHSGVRSDIISVSESPRISNVAGKIDSKANETEKMWHYRDPTRKVQGPFSVAQLRKWSITGYFPAELRVWKISHTENDSILLTDILAGTVDKDLPSSRPNLNAGSAIKDVPSSIDDSKHSGTARSTFSNLSSPTPAKNSFQSSNQVQGGTQSSLSPMPTPTPNAIGVDRSRQFKRVASGNRGENVSPSAMQPTSSQQSFSPSGSRADSYPGSSITNGQQILSQSTVQMGSQPFVAPNSAQNFTNVQPGAVQNPPAYTHGWSSGYVARSETANASMTPNNPNPVPAHVAYGQWTAPAAFNQPPSYNAGYAGPENIATHMTSAHLPAQNEWRQAPANTPWVGQQQQVPGPNMVWAGPPAVAGPIPSAGNSNLGRVARSGNAPWRRGDQNRHGEGGRRNRQSSFRSR